MNKNEKPLEVRESKETVSGVSFPTYIADFEEGDICVRVEVGTTGPGGEEARTYFNVKVLQGGVYTSVFRDSDFDPYGVELAISRDEGIMALLKGFRFMEKVLMSETLKGIAESIFEDDVEDDDE